MKKVKKGGGQRKKRIDKSPREAAVDQLWVLLRRYPQDGLDIEGLILDYLGRTNTTMDKVFDINHLIYTSLFTGTGLDRGLKACPSKQRCINQVIYVKHLVHGCICATQVIKYEAFDIKPVLRIASE